MKLSSTDKLIESLAIMVRENFDEVKSEMDSMKTEIVGMKDGLKEIHHRLDKIDFFINSHDRRLDL